MGGPENGNFSLLYVTKISLHRWAVLKSLKTPLRSIKIKDGSLRKDDFFCQNVHGGMWQGNDAENEFGNVLQTESQ